MTPQPSTVTERLRARQGARVQNTVECRNCGSMNDARDQRCQLCNYRLHLAAPQAAPEAYPLDRSEEHAPSAQSHDARAFQPMLFRGSVHDGKDDGKVVSISSGHGSAVAADLAALQAAIVEEQPAPKQRRFLGRGKRKKQEVVEEVQQLLNLQVAEVKPPVVFPQDKPHCDYRVAIPKHRAMSAAVDLSLVLIAIGMYLGVLMLWQGDLIFNSHALPFLGVTSAMIGLVYRFLWCLLGGRTPGMRALGLQLVDFDGRVPSFGRLVVRQVGGLLGMGAVGLGIVWALIDEEKLTWHDQMSKTFPTAD